MPVATQVSCHALNRFKLPGHLRDVSAGGAFFFADMEVGPGMILRIEFEVPVAGAMVQITCEGSVVRVEPGSLGDKNGIAIQFASLHLS
jgi:hypothetical protein